MSNESRRRTLWQALGLYAAGSWVLLQVVDVLTQNIPLPSWVFLLTLGLLAAGLPVTVATAVIQGRAAAQAQESPSADRASGAHRIFTWANLVRGGVVALAVWGVAVTGWLLASRDSGDGWDVVAGLEEIERLTNDADFTAAYDIARELDPQVGNDSVRTAMWEMVSRTLTVSSEPAGATVLRRDYAPIDAPWEELGTTPVTVERYPFGRSRVRLELKGRESIEVALVSGVLAEAGPFQMAPSGSMPEGMIPVQGGEAYLFVPGLEQLPALDIPDYFLGRLEVTNREYEAFVDGGGYDDPACWTHPFEDGGRTLSFEEAMDRFVDRTGRPGPSTWEAGTYPDGTADHPVGGVSWYEAEAYACFRGMSLPTVYHWYWEADPLRGAPAVPLSNFDGEGPAPVGSYGRTGA
jgi:formylglycine-generating enzyme required for sulfatase activity